MDEHLDEAMDGVMDEGGPEALLAASLYEELTASERATLDAALAASPELRALAAELRGLVSAIPPVAAPALDCDLLPLVRARLHADTAPKGVVVPWRRRWAPALAAAAALVLGVALWQAGGVPEDGATPAVEMASAGVLDGVLSGLAPVLARREYGTAVQTLRSAVAAHPTDAGAGRAVALLADLEYTQLRRYAEAHALYEELKAAHPAEFTRDAEAIHRLDVLAEARAENFASLHALDAAGDSFAALEGVLAQYPNRHVAGMALAAMKRVDCGPGEAESRSAVASLESIRERCTHPVALAQVNLSLGELYWSAQQDPARARAAFMAVAAGGDVGSADLARQALAQLEAAGR